MNSGTYKEGEQKTRAGFYSRFEAAAKARSLTGDRGVVALPVELGWGESKQFISITRDKDVQRKLAMDVNDPSLLFLRLARMWAKEVLLYRVNDGKKALAKLPAELNADVVATAVYGGVKGNDIKVTIATNVAEETKKDVVTYDGVRAIDKQTVADGSDLVDNEMVTFTGTGKLTDTAGISLTGGTNGEVTNLDYIDFFNAAESEYFDATGLTVDNDEQLKTTFASFVKRVREEQGVKFTALAANYAGDYEGISNVTNGFVFEGKTLSPAEAIAWAAGAEAGASIYQSLTGVEVEGATDVYPKFDNDEIEDRLEAGEFMFSYDPRDKKVYVEQDINSLVTFNSERSKRFRKNKIMRILDGIHNDLKRESAHIIRELKARGQDLNVNDDGKQILSAFYSIYYTTLQDNGAIKNFDAGTDIIINETADGDGFEVEQYVQPVDAAEKIYNKIVVA